ncbi:MAG: VWA domain-containing protein [Deltaproteobacteria bacterium]|nr:VWA domain-containing protein [Deltaproteobacteria bacterium]
MLRRSLLALVALSPTLATSFVARAAPAEIVIVLDTSASMAEPSGGPDGETKLDVAARVASRVAAAAAEARHRVGLVRFRQIEETVMSGEGPRVVHVEDEMQCRLVADLLVPVAAEGATELSRWTDRVETADNPEVVALGDSPLYGAVRVALRYLRARRQADPATSCVNAFVVVITDGRDTCASGADLENVLGELRAQSVEEDIRGLVLAFDPDGDAATLIARLGHEADAEVRAFAPDEADDLVDVVASIEGRLAPEACVVSGVAPELVGLPPGTGIAPPPTPPPPPTPDPADDDDDGGCAAAPGSARDPGVFFVLVCGLAAGLAARRRRRALTRPTKGRLGARAGAALALTVTLLGCGDDDGATAMDAGPLADVGAPDAGDFDVEPLVDPSATAEAELARLAGAVEVARRVRRDHLAPLLDPEQVFDGLEGDPETACATLTRSFGYEPYVGTQQGVRGCLATRRCNTLDAARVLLACLEHHGVSGEIRSCRPSAALRPMLAAESAVAAEQPDLTAAHAALREGMEELLADTPDVLELIDEVTPDMTTVVDHDVTSAVDDVVERLLPLIMRGDGSAIVTSGASALHATGRADVGHRTHHYVALADATEIDPVLADSPLPDACDIDAPVDLEMERATLRMQLLVGYADVTPMELTFGAPVLAGEITWNADERWGETSVAAIVDVATRTLPAGTPPPAASSCLRAVLAVGDRTVVGDPFFLQAELADDCGAGAPLVEAMPGRQLASVTLRTEVTVGGETSTLDRVLVDRYGYALREDGAHASGPMFSNETARSLVPMRVDLLASSGLPGPHQRLDLVLEDLVVREADLARAMRAELAEPGAPVEDAPEPLLEPYAWSTVAAFTRHVGSYVPAGSYLLAERPWRIGVVRRRAFVPVEGGLVVAPVRILDIHEMPQTVVDPGARGDSAREAARLEANVALGALVTEAERFAMISFERTRDVVHAGEMFRDDATGPWAPYGSDGHEPTLFPISVRTAHRNRMLNGETLITTAGPASFGGSEYIAWWRVDDRTGNVLGEVRFDGTFYGAAVVIAPPLAPTVVGAILDFNACLWGAAILSLQDGRSVPDVACCQALALDDLAYEMMLDFGGEVFGRLVGDDEPGGRPDLPTGYMNVLTVARLAKRLNEVRTRLEELMDARAFYDSFGMQAACLMGG